MSNKKVKNKKEYSRLAPEIRQEIFVVFLFVFSLISILSLFSLAGRAGDYLSHFLTLIFGYSAGFFIVILIIFAYLLINPQKHTLKFLNYLGLVLFVFSNAGLLNLITKNGGGYLGYYFVYPLKEIFGLLASFIFIIALLLISLLLIFETSFSNIFFITKIIRLFFNKIKIIFNWLKLKTKSSEKEQFLEDGDGFAVRDIEDRKEEGSELSSLDQNHEDQKDNAMEEGQLKIFNKEKTVPIKINIPLDLLDGKESKPLAGDIKANKLIIQKTLENFGIPVEMGDINIGPTVGQYTLKPSEGIKVSQITTLHNDLALALAAHPIRIEAPIPGKSLVGIEVPNQVVATVRLKELLNNSEFKERKNNLILPLGKDVSGQPYMADLKRMPHLLIAGATGSGKTVMLNSIILSLLYQNSPADLKLILIDPKRVELTSFDGLPYLCAPVIVSVEKTIYALKWTIGQMEERLDILSEAKKKDIHSYNEAGGKMPYLILIIDELADLMNTSAQEMETCIIRLAQMARATGIHLIMATQRPSVDIITGLIKANITSRIAFSVASITDSRTILDFGGAEKLLGRGDMLYISSSLGKPKRLQGAFVSDKETQMVVSYLKKIADPEYIDAVTKKPTDDSSFSSLVSSKTDSFFSEAKELVIMSNKASASLLQRRLSIGYSRAARLIDMLEAEGIVGPADGSKPRKILVQNDNNSIEDKGNNGNNEDINGNFEG